jgi:hypothetical protein
METKSMSKKKIYLTYSHNDRRWLEELLTYLSPLRATFEVWTDSQINAGADWSAQIKEAITTSDVVILLVSMNFLASDFLTSVELPSILNAAKSRGTLVLPILISACLWEFTPLAEFQFLNKPDMPLSMLTPAARTKAYNNIVVTLSSILSQTEQAKPGLQASADFAEEIARKIFDRVRAELLVSAQVKGSDRSDQVEEESTLIFVICPYSPDMDPIFEGIREAAKAVGLEAKRVKDVLGDYQITTQLMSMIAKARLIVADLSHEKPNVYFELGYARGLGKTVVTCAREGTAIHFDVKDWTYIPYNDSRVLEKALTERLRFELEKGA